jgi:dTDP-glucose 4,6-dehydratase
LSKTIDWYLENPTWLENIFSGTYKTYYQNQTQ